jgi:hypothetical protein
VPHAPHGPAPDNPERRQATSPRPVVFEEPGPAPLGEQLEFAPDAVRPGPAPEQAFPVPAVAAPAAPAVTAAEPLSSPGQQRQHAVPEPAATPVSVPAASVATPPAAAPEPSAPAAAPAALPEPSVPAAAAGPRADVPVPAGPSASEEAQNRPRAAAKKPAKRRSSVPSWDEIMLGSSRQRD